MTTFANKYNSIPPEEWREATAIKETISPLIREKMARR